MEIMKKVKKASIFCLLMIGLTLPMQAQVPPQPIDDPQGLNPSGAGGGAPVGGGLEFLLLAGALYGARKIYRKKR
jgi:hypothetical protein